MDIINVSDFKRWDVDEGNVNLYFDSIKRGEILNFGFVINQKIVVENIKPAQMKLYDYYEQESFVRQVNLLFKFFASVFYFDQYTLFRNINWTVLYAAGKCCLPLRWL